MAALLGFIANIDGTLSFGERLIGDSEPAPTSKPSAETLHPGFVVTTTSSEPPTQPPPSPQNKPSAKTVQTTTVPAQARPRGPLLISFSIASGLEKGKDKATACIRSTQTWCVIIKDSVMNDSGKVASCTLWWQLYVGNSQIPAEKASVACNTSTGIWLGRKKAMPAGEYRLDANAELTDGTTGTGSYTFTMID